MNIAAYASFAVSVLAIASNSIGIQAVKKPTGDKTTWTAQQKKDNSNRIFLIIMLVISILALLGSGFLIYESFKK